MKKVILVLLLVICMSYIVFAEVGKYQLISGKFFQNIVDLQKGKSEKHFHEGLFKINTETGLVEEYSVEYIIDKEGNIIIEADWKSLTTGKGKVDKEGEFLK